MRIQVFVVAQELVLRGRRLSISSCGTAKQTFSIQNSGNELKLDRIQSVRPIRYGFLHNGIDRITFFWRGCRAVIESS